MTPVGTRPPQEEDLLSRARRGDESAFTRLVEAHRGALHAHCYRMLGSLHDADDALQETLLRAWRGLGRFEGRSATSSWLYRIATNVCLDAISKRSRRVLPADRGPATEPGDDPGAPLAESVWVEPYPDLQFDLEDGRAGPDARYEQREAVELAFIVALQHLPPSQRAVLILRDVLSFSARETAAVFETTVAAVNSSLQRARRAMEERLPERSQQATIRALGDTRLRALVRDFTSAFERGDIEAILALLAEDATFSMPPYDGWCKGREAIGESWLMPSGPPPRLRYAATSANGQLALGTYAVSDDGRSYLPIALDVLTLDGDEISGVIAFRTPEVFSRFSLPDEMTRGD